MRRIDLDSERLYENRKVREPDVRLNQSKYYWAVALPRDEHKKRTCEKIAGARVLEIGCSKGDDAVAYCLAAGSYVGVDISDEAIAVAQSRGIDNAEFFCVDAHLLPFEDRVFDFVIINSLLHHLDLSRSLLEIWRVLGRGGLIFNEPLGINPLFSLYRQNTPEARTEDERPFGLGDLRAMRMLFDLRDVRYYGFTSLISAFLKNPLLREILTKIDESIARTPVRHLFWQFSGFAKKNES